MKLDGKRTQIVDIFYNGVGIAYIPEPEEMEQEFQAKMQRRNADKEKTA